MYLKRLQLGNYGPIQDLDIRFPFDGARPKPVLLVGENGSGKTILLSHIVNAMVVAKDAVYQASGELDVGKVFKLRSDSYISVGAEYYYARCDFEYDLFVRELRLAKPRHTYAEPPMGIDGRGIDAWEKKFDGEGRDHFDTNISEPSLTTSVKKIVRELISARSLLYFPSNRTEEPAWLNRANLRAKPQYTDGGRFVGETRRRLIARSPLRDIHDWLYDVAYDRAAFEMRWTSQTPAPNAPDDGHRQTASLPLLLGYHGDATYAYDSALTILRAIIPELSAITNLRFGIGGRHNRRISLESDQGTLVPNLFQLSSGEMALLALFLSILRDFDLREDRNVPFYSTQDVRGVVVVDEVDLHLHSRHQYEVLPKLVHMFPQVQFVMTTHSPLFVLGVARVFGEGGFTVYDLPSGSPVNPEEFDEFGEAFLAFKGTREFADEVRVEVENSHRPILYVEGPTDRDYLGHAANLLGKKELLDKFEVSAIGGEGKLKTIWRGLKGLPESDAMRVVLLHDPENKDDDEDKGFIHKRKMPHCGDHPISKGIENLFDHETMKKVRQHHPEYIDVDPARTRTVRGEALLISESWSVNEDEKTNLCKWLRAHGTREDYRYFEGVFEVLEPLLRIDAPTPGSEGVVTEAPSDS